MSSTWTFGSLFIPEFYSRVGRYPSDHEIDEAETSWREYLRGKSKPVPYDTTRVMREYNDDGQVVKEYLAPSQQ